MAAGVNAEKEEVKKVLNTLKYSCSVEKGRGSLHNHFRLPGRKRLNLVLPLSELLVFAYTNKNIKPLPCGLFWGGSAKGKGSDVGPQLAEEARLASAGGLGQPPWGLAGEEPNCAVRKEQPRA